MDTCVPANYSCRTVATMARALELVRSKAWPGLVDRFANWAKAVTLPQMDYYYDVLTKQQQMLTMTSRVVLLPRNKGSVKLTPQQHQQQQGRRLLLLQLLLMAAGSWRMPTATPPQQ